MGGGNKRFLAIFTVSLLGLVFSGYSQGDDQSSETETQNSGVQLGSGDWRIVGS